MKRYGREGRRGEGHKLLGQCMWRGGRGREKRKDGERRGDKLLLGQCMCSSHNYRARKPSGQVNLSCRQ